jgi:transcriptional regulator GlxA family with amidase domain
MNIVFFLFDDLTALDAIGPYEVLARIPGAKLTFAGTRRGEVRTRDGLRLGVDAALDEIAACDVLVVPGGFGTRQLERDAPTLEAIRRIDRTTRITASVCTGSLVLGAAGLLAGRRATTHWAMLERLAEHGALPVSERVVRDGKYATAAGVSAGIDFALTLAIELAGQPIAQAIQLGIEYDPAPPLDAGSPARAPAAVRELVLGGLRALDAAAQRDATRAIQAANAST